MALQRQQEAPSQRGLTRAQRQRNLRQAFHVPAPAALQGQRVLLVDDVLTTGATLQAACLASASSRRARGRGCGRGAHAKQLSRRQTRKEQAHNRPLRFISCWFTPKFRPIRATLSAWRPIRAAICICILSQLRPFHGQTAICAALGWITTSMPALRRHAD